MKASNWRWALVALVALLVGGWAWAKTGHYGQQAAIGTGYAAHVACSCRYVGHRDMASCKTDLERGMEPIRLSEDPASKRITATYPLLSTQSATYREGEGCRLDG